MLGILTSCAGLSLLTPLCKYFVEGDRSGLKFLNSYLSTETQKNCVNGEDNLSYRRDYKFLPLLIKFTNIYCTKHGQERKFRGRTILLRDAHHIQTQNCP